MFAAWLNAVWMQSEKLDEDAIICQSEISMQSPSFTPFYDLLWNKWFC